jgi:Ni/Co efflux regulator RcnB
MKRFLSVLMLSVVASSFAWAASSAATLTPVKATHPRARHHHAHKAKKHHMPKRHHNSV